MTKEQIINFCESNNFEPYSIRGTKDDFVAFEKNDLIISISHYYPCDKDVLVFRDDIILFFDSENTNFDEFKAKVLEFIK